jgi:hypothetical protein
MSIHDASYNGVSDPYFIKSISLVNVAADWHTVLFVPRIKYYSYEDLLKNGFGRPSFD